MKVAVGVDIGGTNTKTILVTEDGEVLGSQISVTPSISADSAENMEDLFIKKLQDFLASENTKGLLSGAVELAGIGIGIAGLVDRIKGEVIKSPNIPALKGRPIKDAFEKAFSLPVIVENDANAYAFGEKWVGSGREFNSFLLLTLGTGLGGGLVYNGELFEAPMEIGHIVIEPNGRSCPCGSLGCLESYASGRAVVDRIIHSIENGAKSRISECCEGNFYRVTPESAFKYALDGDNLAREVFREAGQYLGTGIANMINIFGCEAVIIGGGLLGAWDLFISDLKKEVSKRAFKPLSENIKILKSSLTNDAGSIGAAGLLFRKIASSR